mmetsp:Transcript_78557/g.139371  ORF Transcript_78557/g.139371 Transcript_78557/m.139371 type:complete len:272 (-) Transcript_78557:26-841(-)
MGHGSSHGATAALQAFKLPDPSAFTSPGHPVTEGADAEGKAPEGKLSRKMGRTEDEEPCECTDPIKKKKKGMKGLLGGGLNRNHDEVSEKLEEQQRKAERDNAHLAIKGPLSKFDHAMEKMTTALEDLELYYSHYRHMEDEYFKAYNELSRVMTWHCKGMQRHYKDIRLDCEKTRLEAQDEYFARRHSPACMIGEKTPFEDLDAKSATCPAEALVLARVLQLTGAAVAASGGGVPGRGGGPGLVAQLRSARRSRRGGGVLLDRESSMHSFL